MTLRRSSTFEYSVLTVRDCVKRPPTSSRTRHTCSSSCSSSTTNQQTSRVTSQMQLLQLSCQMSSISNARASTLPRASTSSIHSSTALPSLPCHCRAAHNSTQLRMPDKQNAAPLLVVAGCSGVGKSVLIGRLIDTYPSIFSVSTSTAVQLYEPCRSKRSWLSDEI
jgi:hypothetical protein